MKLKLRVFGIMLVLAGVIGFLTVADDLSHKGELIGVASILIAGLIILSISFFYNPKDKESTIPTPTIDS